MPDAVMPIEVFYSYADADKDLYIELNKHLSLLHRDGLITTWHKRQIIAGQDWTKILDQHLNTASIVLLLVSPDFVASDYCYGTEMQRAMERHEVGEAHVIPILLRPVDWQSAPFGTLQALPGNGKPITQWSNRDAAFADVALGIRTALQEVRRLAVSTPPTDLPRSWNTPYPRNPFFTGQENVLTQLAKVLRGNQSAALSQPQAINGLGGIGKTHIAIEYAYQHRQDYQAVLWTLADTREALISGYVAIARLLNLPEKDEQDQGITVNAVIRWLETHTKWLLILDSADDLALVYEFLPPLLGGHLLLTTRAQATGTRASPIEVDTMPQDVGALFLLRRAKRIPSDATLTDTSIVDVTTAREICDELGGLPLALDQAGAYIEETGCGLSDYFDLFKREQKTLLKRRGKLPTDHQQSVATTFALTFEKVRQKSEAAVELLSLCSYLAPDAIPLELIIQGIRHLGPILETIASDALKLDQTLEILQAYSLIQRDGKNRTFSIHRLVQAVLRDGIDEQIQGNWMQRTIQAVNETFPEVEFKEWTKCERLLPHVLSCANWIEHESMTISEAAHVLNETGFYLKERGHYIEAERLLRQALAIRERMGTENLNTASSLNDLAVLYWNQGKYEQAEPLYMRALAIREQHLGTKHPLTANCLDNLAILYRYQGKYEQAEPLYMRALAIREQHLGTEHPATATSLNNLAIFYRHQKKYEQAEMLFLRALSIREQRLGPDHPDTAKSLNHLAMLYTDQEKYEQAEPLHQRALLIKEHSMGTMHPSTASSHYGLATLYAQQGKYKDAELFYQRALAIREEHLGADHPETQETRESYTALLQVIERNAEAIALESHRESS